nr:hypothetical protein GCM10020241_13110 [Streptoalloteichus tenebrarius]
MPGATRPPRTTTRVTSEDSVSQSAEETLDPGSAGSAGLGVERGAACRRDRRRGGALVQTIPSPQVMCAARPQAARPVLGPFRFAGDATLTPQPCKGGDPESRTKPLLLRSEHVTAIHGEAGGVHPVSLPSHENDLSRR